MLCSQKHTFCREVSSSCCRTPCNGTLKHWGASSPWQSCRVATFAGSSGTIGLHCWDASRSGLQPSFFGATPCHSSSCTVCTTKQDHWRYSCSCDTEMLEGISGTCSTSLGLPSRSSGLALQEGKNCKSCISVACGNAWENLRQRC